MDELRKIQALIATEERYLISCNYVRSRQLGALLRKQRELYKQLNRG